MATHRTEFVCPHCQHVAEIEVVVRYREVRSADLVNRVNEAISRRLSERLGGRGPHHDHVWSTATGGLVVCEVCGVEANAVR